MKRCQVVFRDVVWAIDVCDAPLRRRAPRDSPLSDIAPAIRATADPCPPHKHPSPESEATCISLGTKSVTFQSHLPLDVTLITLCRYKTVVGDWRLSLHFVTLTARLSRKWTPSAWCLLSCIRSRVRMVLVEQCLRASGDSDRPASHYRPYL